MEDNPNEISGVPFVTHFVTNYLGDKNETLKHERILEEQLIKDLELMGSELELVDDCKRKPIASAPYPHLADACLDSCPIPASLGEALAGDTQLAMEHPALLMDIEGKSSSRPRARPSAWFHRRPHLNRLLEFARCPTTLDPAEPGAACKQAGDCKYAPPSAGFRSGLANIAQTSRKATPHDACFQSSLLPN